MVCLQKSRTINCVMIDYLDLRKYFRKRGVVNIIRPQIPGTQSMTNDVSDKIYTSTPKGSEAEITFSTEASNNEEAVKAADKTLKYVEDC